MPTVLLIRHGENQYVKTGRLAGRLGGVHLNEKGRQQANQVADALKDLKIKAVYSSPLDRTMETAAPIAKAHKLKVIPREGLQEVDFGSWQDKTIKQLSKRKLWQKVQQIPSQARFPQGESFPEAQFRITQEIETLVAKHKPKEIIVCVGHSDMIKLAVAHFLGLPLDLFQRLHIQPASISTLYFGEGPPRLINMNLPPRPVSDEAKI